MKNIILIGLGIILVAVITGCVSPETPNDSDNGLKPENYCEVLSDCNAKDLIHPMCVGEWTCIENKCVWECDTQLIPPETKPPVEPPTKPPELTKETCQTAGGHWNGCGSACRGAPEGTACIALCVSYCECGGIAGFGCPQGYVCTDFIPENAADAMGICRAAKT